MTNQVATRVASLSQVCRKLVYNIAMSYLPQYRMTEKIRQSLREIERISDTATISPILPEIEASIRYRSSVEAIHSSTSIEGNPLSLQQVERIIAAPQNLTKEQYAELEVRNYKEALDFITKRRHGNADITVNDILSLHRLISTDLLDDTRCGKFRANPVYIEGDKHQVIYTAAPANIIVGEVSDLLDWLNSTQYQVHPVIAAAVLHLHFVAIHPFADSNGRTTRALTSLYLALMNYDCNGSLVLDSYYATNRAEYYNILQLVNGKDYQSSTNADLTPWIEYFTAGYLSSLHVLNAEIRMLSSLLPANRPKLSSEEIDIVNHISQFGSISISEAEKILPNINRRTIQRKLRQLVDFGYIKLTGSTNDARYVLKSKN